MAQLNAGQAKGVFQESIPGRFPRIKKRASEWNEQLEERASQIPSTGFLVAAGASIFASAILAFSQKRKPMANFVGLWAPSLLLMAIYTKLLRLEKGDES